MIFLTSKEQMRAGMEKHMEVMLRIAQTITITMVTIR